MHNAFMKNQYSLMKKSTLLTLITLMLMTESCATKKNNFPHVSFETNFGKITVMLYAETPLHRDNFLKLVDEGFYNGVLFHRVIADFMIQAGDPDSRTALPVNSLGAGDVGYTVPAEFVYPQYYHKRGALAAARQSDQANPKKASSGCQFYIVQGRTFSEAELNVMEANNEKRLEARLFNEVLNTRKEDVKRYRLERNQVKLDQLRDSVLAVVHSQMQANPSYKFTEQQRKDYLTVGGTPHLDGEYTVFGEVTEGLDVVQRISQAKTGRADRPTEDIRIIKARRVD